jgi:hypothetical protein
VRQVLSIRLQELVDLDAMRKAARVIEQLPYRDAARDQADLPVELEGALVDELKHDGGDEELGHAGDPEAMLQGHRRFGLRVGNTDGLLPGEIRAGRQGDDARDACAEHYVEMVVARFHSGVGRLDVVDQPELIAGLRALRACVVICLRSGYSATSGETRMEAISTRTGSSVSFASPCAPSGPRGKCAASSRASRHRCATSAGRPAPRGTLPRRGESGRLPVPRPELVDGRAELVTTRQPFGAGAAARPVLALVRRVRPDVVVGKCPGRPTGLARRFDVRDQLSVGDRTGRKRLRTLAGPQGLIFVALARWLRLSFDLYGEVHDR